MFSGVYYSLTLKEKVTLHNLEAIIKHIRERVENGREASVKEIPTLPLSELLICWKTLDEVRLFYHHFKVVCHKMLSRQKFLTSACIVIEICYYRNVIFSQSLAFGYLYLLFLYRYVLNSG